MATAISCRVTLPEELVRQLEAEADHAKVSFDEFVANRLQTFARISPKERCLILGQVDLHTLADIVGRPLRDEADLLEWCRRVGVVGLGEAKMRLTVPQLDRLKTLADRHGVKVETELARILKRVFEQLDEALG